MKENNVIVKIDEKANRTEVAKYGGNHSAEYALYLYWCQYLMHVDYMNLANRRKYNEQRTIGFMSHNVFVEHGTDIYICRGTKEHGYSAIVGDNGSEYDFKPNYEMNN